MKTLDLVLKHKWFDMIARGEKKDEYREVRPYWTKRFLNMCPDCRIKTGGDFCLRNCSILKVNRCLVVNFDKVRFHRGYTGVTMTCEVKCVYIGFGIPKWGAETNMPYYVIRLGKQLSKTM